VFVGVIHALNLQIAEFLFGMPADLLQLGNAIDGIESYPGEPASDLLRGFEAARRR